MPAAPLASRHGRIALLAAAGLGLALGSCSGIEPIPVKSNNDPTGPGLLTGPSGVFTIPMPGPSSERKTGEP